MENSHSKVRILDIGPRHHDQRLDNFLLSQLKGVPKSRIYKLLRSGQVRVNKGRKKPDYRLQQGDQVRIPPVTMSEKDPSQVPQYLLDMVASNILYEDKNLLVLNKPAGIAVHAGSNVSHGVIEALRQLKPDCDSLELVHRLDRDTSGCLVLAKTRPMLMQLHELFRQDRGLQKIYRALLVGRWQGGERLIDAPLLKNTLQGGERMVMVDTAGKPAQSLFNPLAYYPDATLAEIELYTGRTHQIRVHAAHIGHPVAGDPKYGDEKFNQSLKQQGFKRMYLHAWKLSFRLDRQYSFTAPLDNEWERLVQTLDTERL
ncbi:MAG: RluA family pseudouridine synthase [Gammaproteobacteria bacterium]|nr:MAG: RluA family pseudouridine synthase [Gammaproteobacteria bacterium]